MDARAIEGMLELASDIDELEQIASQADKHGNTRSNRGGRGGPRSLFGWSTAPSIERAKAAHVVEEPIVAKECAEPEKAVSIIHIFAGADVTSYSELIGVIRTRVGQLGVRYLDFDQLACFAEGLSGKIFGPAQIKRLGIEKMFDALRAAGLRLRIEEDPEQTAKMQARIAENYSPRQAQQARPNNDSNMSNATIDKVLSNLANRKGGLTRLRAAVKEARSNMARYGGKASWEKKRAAGPVDFATYLGNPQIRPPALRPPEEPGSSSTNPCSTEAAA
jgi:hypothetical protein